MENIPLSPLQRTLYRNAPADWTTLDRDNNSGTRATLDVLVRRGLVEKRATSVGVMWRKTPATLEQAVRRLVDQLPQTDRGLEVYHAAEELREVRVLLASRDAALRHQVPMDYSGSVHTYGGVGFAP